MSTSEMTGLSRRRFIQYSAAAATIAVTAREGWTENLGYIDAHSHLWSPDRTHYPLRPGAKEEDVVPKGFTVGDFFSHARPEGVTRVVAVGHTIHFGFDATYLTDLVKSRPGEVAVQAYLDHTDVNAAARMAELKAKGVKAFRLRLQDPWQAYFPDSHPIMKVYEFAAMQRLVICPLINPDWLPQLGRLSEAFPSTTVAIDHFARIGVDGFGKVPPVPGTIKPEDVANLVKLARYPGVHVKISAYYALGKRTPPYDDMIPFIKELLKAYGAERLMWGSDCPYQIASGQTYRASIALVRDRLDGVSEEEREWLLHKTAERVFFS
ncbi:MAG TPA: amidohydrolase family protein [Candidatus Methylomirabilis sp.]|nr:amidohydrolase family protein [Candidatus Methylomirabilis sp.]